MTDYNQLMENSFLWLLDYFGFDIINLVNQKQNSFFYSIMDHEQLFDIQQPPNSNLFISIQDAYFWNDKRIMDKILSFDNAFIFVPEYSERHKLESTKNVKFIQFHYWMHQYYIDIWGQDDIELCDVINKAEHDWLCFNGRKTPWRAAIFAELELRNPNGWHSMLNRYRPDNDWIIAEQACESFKRNCDFIFEYFGNFKEKVLDINTNEVSKNDRQQTKRLYNHTNYSIVTETNYFTEEKDFIFLTEKSFKPIVNLHPFIIVGNKGSLEALRNIGYETFPELFDETYDSADDQTRFDIICSNIGTYDKRIVSDKLWKNRELFLDKDYHKGLIAKTLREAGLDI